MRALLLGLCLVSLDALAQGSIFPSKEEKAMAAKLDPATVSDESRKFLKGKMKNHMKDAKELAIAVSTLKYDRVTKLALDIEVQPRLDPASGPAMKLPPGFFSLQDMLKRNAHTLGETARTQDIDATFEAYTNVVATCMACHAAFFQPKGAPVTAPAPAPTAAPAPPPTAPVNTAPPPPPTTAPAPKAGTAAPPPPPAPGPKAPAPPPPAPK